MASHPLAQLLPLVTQASRILLIGRQDATMDECAAMTVLAQHLTELGKRVRCVVPGLEQWPAPLQALYPLESTLGPIRSLEISLPVDRVPLAELTYAIEDAALRLTLMPKDGMWSPSEILVRPGQPAFDLVIAVQTTKEALAELVPNDREWMQTLPSITLSTDPLSESWSSLPLLFVTRTGLAEDIAAWLMETAQTITTPVAHNLLTGMIASSKSFRSPRVRSDTLRLASQLVERGADRQAIMHQLWRTVPVASLNLWGRAMMRLTPHATLPLATTLLTAHDFLQTKSEIRAIPELSLYVFDRLPETQALLILYSTPHGTSARLCTRRPLEAQVIAQWFGGKGATDQAEWSMSTADLLEAQREILLVLERELPRLQASR